MRDASAPAAPAHPMAPAKPQPSPGSPNAGVGRASIGLGLAGLGASILGGVIPHEDWVVGAGLLVFGVVLVATGRLPWAPLSPSWVLFAGLLAGGTVLANVALTHQIGGPQMLAALLAAILLATGPLCGRRLTPPASRRDVAPEMLALGGGVALGAPLALWAAQAAFKHASGTTPIEWFDATLLVLPVHWMLGALGIQSVPAGQTLRLATPRGPLAVEVGVACSGLQAMALFLGILAVFAVATKPSGKRLAAWSAVGLAGVYVANLLRLVAVVWAGWRFGAQTLQDVHANAGWVFFVAWSLLFALYVRRDLRRAEATGSPTR